jgi:hypothetical protein
MTIEKLGELLNTAVKASVAEIARQGISKADDQFVKFGR